jgi:IcmF-related N-terminal domain
MWTRLAAVWEWIKWAVTALMPFKQGVAISPMVRWVVWIVLDLALLVVLYFLNDRFDFTGAVRLPRALAELTWLRHLYLPILGQLVVLIGVVLYWFYLLWFSTPDASPFPDIDEAWQEAMRAIAQAGIQLPGVPLFLVLGRPASGEDHLFEASGLKLVVKQTPANPNAPVHVWADREAVYVTCRGASVLGKLAGILALEDVPETAAVSEEAPAEDLDKTHVGGRKEQGLIEMLRASMGQEATPLKKRGMRRAAMGKPLGSDFLSDPKEVVRFKARLAHLCGLIVRDRQPFCAANGILLLVPLGGTDSPAEAQFTAQACQEDLHVARHEMRLDCPLVSLLVDLEELPGFAEYMRRQPPKELGNRRGNGFPMSTRLSREEVLQQVRISLAWVCTTYLQDGIYRIFDAEKADTADVSPIFAGNSRLVLLLEEMNARTESVCAIVQQAIAPAHDALFRYAGCYLAATGGKGSQGFVAGVFQKLVKEQSSVSWTQTALAEDAQCLTWATYYLAAAGVLAVLWCLLLAWIILR